jgi:subtilisin-like proprotein convertase family protein
MRKAFRLLLATFSANFLFYSNPAFSENRGGLPSVLVSGFNTGPIPDNNPAGRSINFLINGFSGQVVSAEVELGINHTWSGDVTATLISPNGLARLVVLGRANVGANSNTGSSANLLGTYTFGDFAASSFWAALPVGNFNIPTGFYRSSSVGVPTTRHGGCNTSFAGAFGELTPANVNGVWSLIVTDSANTDTGTVTDAKLRLYFNPLPEALFTDGLENAPPFTAAPPPATVATEGFSGCTPAPFDYFGSGRTSFALVRAIGGSALQWLTKDNNGAGSGIVRTTVFGSTTDIVLGGDFDGDTIADLALWRPSLGKFSVIRSSRPNDQPLEIRLGQTGDNPRIVDDYDGDSRTDFAVHRAGLGAGSPSRTEIILSNGGRVALQTGETGALPVGGSDGNGDGRADIWIQSDAGAGVGRLRAFDSLTGTLLQDFTAGISSDFVTLGQYVGTAVNDVMIMRTVSNSHNWLSRDGASGVLAPAVVFGTTGNFRLGADFDGDGIRDLANWANGAASQFNWRKSSDSSVGVQAFGLDGDYPPANSVVY